MMRAVTTKRQTPKMDFNRTLLPGKHLPNMVINKIYSLSLNPKALAISLWPGPFKKRPHFFRYFYYPFFCYTFDRRTKTKILTQRTRKWITKPFTLNLVRKVQHSLSTANAHRRVKTKMVKKELWRITLKGLIAGFFCNTIGRKN